MTFRRPNISVCMKILNVTLNDFSGKESSVADDLDHTIEDDLGDDLGADLGDDFVEVQDGDVRNESENLRPSHRLSRETSRGLSWILI